MAPSETAPRIRYNQHFVSFTRVLAKVLKNRALQKITSMFSTRKLHLEVTRYIINKCYEVGGRPDPLLHGCIPNPVLFAIGKDGAGAGAGSIQLKFLGKDESKADGSGESGDDSFLSGGPGSYHSDDEANSDDGEIAQTAKAFRKMKTSTSTRKEDRKGGKTRKNKSKGKGKEVVRD